MIPFGDDGRSYFKFGGFAFRNDEYLQGANYEGSFPLNRIGFARRLYGESDRSFLSQGYLSFDFGLGGMWREYPEERFFSSVSHLTGENKSTSCNGSGEDYVGGGGYGGTQWTECAGVNVDESSSLAPHFTARLQGNRLAGWGGIEYELMSRYLPTKGAFILSAAAGLRINMGRSAELFIQGRVGREGIVGEHQDPYFPYSKYEEELLFGVRFYPFRGVKW